MSSSKVFKKDAHFTPTSLVRRSIAAVRNDSKSGAAAPPSRPPDAAVSAEQPQPVEQPTITNREPPPPPVDVGAIRQEGYNQGMADLAGQYQTQLEQTIGAFAEACQKLDQLSTARLQQGRGDLVNLIILLCEKILAEELRTPRNVIAATLQAALEQAIKSEEHYVTLHPDDLAVAEAKAPELIAAIRGLERIIFTTDDTMTRGGCRLESAVGTVDATIETQLTGLREMLIEQPLLLPVGDLNALLPPESAGEETGPQP